MLAPKLPASRVADLRKAFQRTACGARHVWREVFRAFCLKRCTRPHAGRFAADLSTGRGEPCHAEDKRTVRQRSTGLRPTRSVNGLRLTRAYAHLTARFSGVFRCNAGKGARCYDLRVGLLDRYANREAIKRFPVGVLRCVMRAMTASDQLCGHEAYSGESAGSTGAKPQTNDAMIQPRLWYYGPNCVTGGGVLCFQHGFQHAGLFLPSRRYCRSQAPVSSFFCPSGRGRARRGPVRLLRRRRHYRGPLRACWRRGPGRRCASSSPRRSRSTANCR